MSWVFDKAARADIYELMNWFPDARSIEIWSGPSFRYPFTRRTFRKDIHWGEISSYRLENPDGEFVAFGQLRSRFQRPHLARLITHPEMRGHGIGRRLITSLLDAAKREYESAECGLFVYKDNEAAYRCYRSLGFEIHDYPEGAPMRELCHYMTCGIS